MDNKTTGCQKKQKKIIKQQHRELKVEQQKSTQNRGELCTEHIPSQI